MSMLVVRSARLAAMWLLGYCKDKERIMLLGAPPPPQNQSTRLCRSA